MKKIFQKIILWLYIKIHSIFINISIALRNTEEEILKADPNISDEKNKHIQRKRHKNQVLEKFYAGQRDEKYVQDYYEILKKADKFMRDSTPHQIAVATDKHLRFAENEFNDVEDNQIKKKDQYGRRYEHYGFFDENHKHAGKTLGEVLALEAEERRTKDDDYELLYIFNNKPIEVGLANIMDIIEKTDKENVDFEFEVLDIFRKSKQFEFPIKVMREYDVLNKIEQLTEFLHVKKIGFDYRQLEFFIPLKFKTDEIEELSEIFYEITNIKSIFVRNEYGDLLGFGINKLIKRIKHNNTHEVWKFEGIEMQNVNLK